MGICLQLQRRGEMNELNTLICFSLAFKILLADYDYPDYYEDMSSEAKDPNNRKDTQEIEQEKEVVRIMTKPLNISVPLGNTIRLPCKTNQTLPTDVIWTFFDTNNRRKVISIGEKIVAAGDDLIYTVAKNKKSSDLIINSPSFDFHGRYQCGLAKQDSVKITHMLFVVDNAEALAISSSGSKAIFVQHWLNCSTVILLIYRLYK